MVETKQHPVLAAWIPSRCASLCVSWFYWTAAVLAATFAFDQPLVAQSKDATPDILSFNVQVTIAPSLQHVSVLENIVVKNAGQDSMQLILSAIPLGDVTFKNVTLQSGTRQDIPLAMVKNSDGLWHAEITFTPTDDLQTLKISYELISNDSTLYLPLIYPPWKPVESKSDLFGATLILPPDVKLVESFPTRVEDGPSVDNKQTREINLSAIPSVLWLRLADQQNKAFGAGTIVDIAVLIILCLLGLIGWRFRKMLGMPV